MSNGRIEQAYAQGFADRAIGSGVPPEMVKQAFLGGVVKGVGNFVKNNPKLSGGIGVAAARIGAAASGLSGKAYGWAGDKIHKAVTGESQDEATKRINDGAADWRGSQMSASRQTATPQTATPQTAARDKGFSDRINEYKNQAVDAVKPITNLPGNAVKGAAKAVGAAGGQIAQKGDLGNGLSVPGSKTVGVGLTGAADTANSAADTVNSAVNLDAKGVAQNATETGLNAVNTVNQGAKNVMGGATQLAKPFMGEAAGKAVDDTVGKGVDLVTNPASEAVEGAGKVLGQGADTVNSAAKGDVGGVLKGTTGMAAHGVNTGVKTMGALAKGVTGGYGGETIDNATGAVANTVDKGRQAVSDATDTATGAVTDAGKYVGNKAVDAGKAVGEGVADAGKWVGRKLDPTSWF